MINILDIVIITNIFDAVDIINISDTQNYCYFLQLILHSKTSKPPVYLLIN